MKKNYIWPNIIILAAIINTIYYSLTEDLFSKNNYDKQPTAYIEKKTLDIYIIDEYNKIVYDRNMRFIKKSKVPVYKQGKYYHTWDFDIISINKTISSGNDEFKLPLLWILDRSRIRFIADISSGSNKEVFYISEKEGFFECISNKAKKIKHQYIGKNSISEKKEEIIKFINLDFVTSKRIMDQFYFLFYDSDGLYRFDLKIKKMRVLENNSSPNFFARYLRDFRRDDNYAEFILSQSDNLLKFYDTEFKKKFEIDLNFLPKKITNIKYVLTDSFLPLFYYNYDDTNYQYHNYLLYDLNGKLVKQDSVTIEKIDDFKTERYDLIDMINYSQIGNMPVLLLFNQKKFPPPHKYYYHNRLAGDIEYKIEYFLISLSVGFALCIISFLICRIFKRKFYFKYALPIFLFFPLTGIFIYFMLKKNKF